MHGITFHAEVSQRTIGSSFFGENHYLCKDLWVYIKMIWQLMNFMRNYLFNRNVIMIIAVICGLFFNGLAELFKPYTLYVLGFVMALSSTGLSFGAIFPIKETARIMGYSVFLNFIIFPLVLIPVAFLMIPDPIIFYGVVVIAASPVGAAVLPFTSILKGNLKFSLIGMFGVYLASIFMTPFLIYIFTSQTTLSPWTLGLVMVQVIVFPLLLSRLLLFKSIEPYLIKFRGRFIDLGFALIIYTAVGLNNQVFFTEYGIFLRLIVIMFLSVFVLGRFYEYFTDYLGIESSEAISQNLILTIKSSAFTAATSLALFGQKAAVPSAVLSVFVLLYLLFLSIRNHFKTPAKP